ncbi:ribonuclease H-like domain-containing protein [Peptoniphilus sp. GNH]|nr:ribonuclease H-like domain-containing protein [Peptoniphilus sp. GNH]
MQKITHTLDNAIDLNEHSIVLDIETSGLSKNRDSIILIGVLYKKYNQIIIEQYYAEKFSDEIYLLEAAVELLNSFKKIITYNGDSFDLAFLNEKINFYGLKNLDIESFDLYKLIKNNRNVLGFKKMTQTYIESFLNFQRPFGDISGKGVIEIYKSYLKHKEGMQKILDHNFYDLLGLLNCLKVEDLIFKARTIKSHCGNFYYENFKVEKNLLSIRGKNLSSKNIYIENPVYNLIIDENSFNIDVFLQDGLYDESRVCKFVFRDNFLGLTDQSNIKFPQKLCLISLVGKNFEENILQICKIILENLC